jgi:prolyl 4-hydroxylase
MHRRAVDASPMVWLCDSSPIILVRKTHHDYVPTERNEYQGPRILTIFLYLSNVKEGGGTNFPALNLTVEPLLGRALIWPSVHNHKPNDLDLRALHQALPVVRGVKYGANVWLHQRDLQPASCRAEAGLEKTNDY